MRPALVFGASILVLLVLSISTGCNKEKIVESTEYIRETEYIEQPPDTVTVHDTITQTVHYYDTTTLIDTVFQTDNVFDTMIVVDTVYESDLVYDTIVVTDTLVTVVNYYDTTTTVDTIYQIDPVYDTVVQFDTIVTVEHHYDTTYSVDTVGVSQASPVALLAYTAMQYYSDPIVLEFINQEFGETDGWIFYMSIYQNEVAYPSTGVYDFYGQIDYWTPDWSGFYPFEYYWRLTYVSGDPADPRNWGMSDPPGEFAPGRQAGVNRAAAREPTIETN